MSNLVPWPSYVELNVGDIVCVRRTVDGHSRRWRLRLVEVAEHHGECTGASMADQDELRACEQLKIRINNIPVILYRRAFQPPVVVDGLRIYVETTQLWADRTGMEMLRPERQVRISAVAENELWGNGDFRLPVDHLHWNAMRGLEHWGFQGFSGLGRAEMERLTDLHPSIPVRTAFTGDLTEASTQTSGAWQQHRFLLRHPLGFQLEYHLRERISRRVMTPPRQNIQASWELLDKPADSAPAKPDQTMDLGLCLTHGPLHLSIFPYLLDAWVGNCTVPVWVMTERMVLARVGEPVLLDGTRRMALRNRRMQNVAWLLHNGRRVDEVVPHVTYERPGIFTEQLIVEDDQGNVVRDFLEVRVMSDDRFPMNDFSLKEVAVSSHEIEMQVVGLEGLNTGTLDFGDGCVAPLPTEPTLKHHYNEPGQYIVTLNARQHNGQPVVLKAEFDTRHHAIAHGFG